MSNLKHQSLTELEESLVKCNEYISRLKTQLAGQYNRKEWIEKYIFEKTPKEMTIQQIEQALGHKVIIK